MAHSTGKRVVFSCPTSMSRRLAAVPASRLYHSATYPQPQPFSQTEHAILAAALKHVPNHGFTENALVRGARDAGYLDVSTNLFPRGAFDLVRYHLVMQRLGLRDKVSFQEEEGRKVGMGEKIKQLAWTRLQANAQAGIVGKWSEALAIMAQPTYIPASMEELALLADEMWYLAGDGDVSFAWYTKRASLSAIYASSELFMTQDSSQGFSETEKFLDRRLSEVRSAGSAVGNVGEWAGFSAGALINVLRSKGMRI